MKSTNTPSTLVAHRAAALRLTARATASWLLCALGSAVSAQAAAQAAAKTPLPTVAQATATATAPATAPAATTTATSSAPPKEQPAAQSTAPPSVSQPAPSSAAPIELKPEQVRALGVVSAPATGKAQAPAAVYPAHVSVPPAQQRVVAAPLAGLVTSLGASVGEPVKAGQTLAVLRSGAAQELQRDVVQSRSQADLTSRSLARDELLFQEGLISAARLDASRAADQQARALQTERQRALALSGSVGTGTGTGSGSANTGEPGTLVLKSPISGVVLESTAAVGLRAEAATALFRVANLSVLWLELQVPASDIQRLHIGDALQVSGTPHSGRVISIGHAVDPASQTVPVRAQVQTATGVAAGVSTSSSSGRVSPLRPGQLVEVQLAAQDPGLARVSESALVQGAQGPAVFVEAAPGRYVLTPVTVRANAAGQVVIDGVAREARVVVQGTAALRALLRG